MAEQQKTVTKALAAEEDFLFGEGTTSQLRAGAPTSVTKVRMLRPVNSVAELTALDEAKFPKALLIENGRAKLYQHNGSSYEQVLLERNNLDVTTTVTTLSALGVQNIFFTVGSAHTVSSITDGFKGQKLTLVATNGNTTIAHGASVNLKGGVDLNIPANTGIELVYTGSIWAEV